MKITIPFVKMSGAGNDFIVIDNMNQSLRCERQPLALALCTAHTGIGADGVLILSPSTKADFLMEYFNADGSYGGMCGNGGRCAARYAYVAGIAASNMIFEALDYIYRAHVHDESVRLRMKDPVTFRENLSVASSIGTVVGDFVDTGAPHFVVVRDDLQQIPLEDLGRSIRYHPMFVPDGCNVNAVKVQPDGTVLIRTYERGVEAETLACGTGCVASAIILAKRYSFPSPITLRVKSGEDVRVYFDFREAEFSNIVLEGSAHFVFSGQATFDTDTNMLTDSPDVLAHLRSSAT